MKLSQKSIIFCIGAILVFAIIQVLISAGLLSNFWVTIIQQGAVMTIVALGLNLIYGFNGQFSLGQFGFYAIGAYTSADITYRWFSDHNANGLTTLFLVVILAGGSILLLQSLFARIRGLDALSAFTLYLLVVFGFCFVSVKLGNLIAGPFGAFLDMLPKVISNQLVFLFAVIIGGLVAAGISFLIGLPVLTLGSDYFGIATMGLTIIIKVLLDNSDTLLGFEEMKGARGMIGIPKMTSWIWVCIFLFIIIIVTRNLLQSSYGRAIISVREDETAAKTMGIDVTAFKSLTFVIGSLFAGIGGGLYAHINGFLHPDTFNFIKSFDPMIIVVLGGLGSITGTVAAAFTWALVLEGVLRLVLPQGFETWRFVVYPLLLLLTMLLKPKGLLGDFEIPFLRATLPPLRKKNAQKSSPVTVSANDGARSS